jgi:hypothetical protein
MNCWEIIADDLSIAGWSLGWVSAIDSQGRTFWITERLNPIWQIN